LRFEDQCVHVLAAALEQLYVDGLCGGGLLIIELDGAWNRLTSSRIRTSDDR